MMKYEIYVLSGNSIISNLRKINDMNSQDGISIDNIEKTVNSYSMNAVLFQIKRLLPENTIDDSNLFADKLIYIDFGKVPFSEKAPKELEEIFKDGLTIKFENHDSKIFVPFQYSNSQSKKCIISFIDKTFFYDIRCALDLDLYFYDYALDDIEKFKKIPNVQISKLYSYRGLYMTDSKKIDLQEDETTDDHTLEMEDAFEENTESNDEKRLQFSKFLNNKNIIVISDKIATETVSTDKFITYEQDSSKDGKFLLKQIENQKSTTTISKNYFDGEGLISKEAAIELNRLLDVEFENEKIELRDLIHTSFQIRLPFVKGVLHTVDFHDYFYKIYGDKFETTEIIDTFGKKRILKDVQIILTESMFKLISLGFNRIKWDKEDPMEYYFKKVKEYSHGLYIAATNKKYKNSGFVNLSSQFINTLKLTNESFKELVAQHVERANKPINDLNLETTNCAWQQYLLHALANAKEEDYTNTLKALLSDPYIYSQLEGVRKGKINNIARAKISVNGYYKILSQDLMYFLQYIRYQLIEGKKMPKDLKNITAGKVFLTKGDFENNQRVVVLRSPHLSPNENVTAKLLGENKYIDANTDIYNDYKKLFGHLDILMVGHLSCLPLAIGGADFDGDAVNVIFEKSVLKGCENNSFYANGRHEKSLKAVIIPSPKSQCSMRTTSDGEKPHYINYPVIRSTFNNAVGKISNAALRIAAVEQAFPDETPAIFASDCVALTGLEIDSTKSGIKPCLDECLDFSQNLKEKLKVVDALEDEKTKVLKQVKIVEEIDFYLKTKSAITDATHCSTPKKADDEAAYYVNLTDKEIKINENAELPILTQLLYAWADNFSQKSLYGLRKSYSALRQYFLAKDNVSAPIEQIYEAYYNVQKLANEDAREKRRLDRYNNIDKIITILKEQYDRMPITHSALENLIERFSLVGREKLDATINQYFKESIPMPDKSKQENSNFDVSDGAASHQSFVEKLIQSPEEYWPFLSNNSEVQTKVIDNIFDDLLGKNIKDDKAKNFFKNYSYQGYKLLFYVLETALSNAIIEENEKTYSDFDDPNPYFENFYKIYKYNLKRGLSKSACLKKLQISCSKYIHEIYFGFQQFEDDTELSAIDIYPTNVFEKENTDISSRKELYELFWNMVDYNEKANKLVLKKVNHND